MLEKYQKSFKKGVQNTMFFWSKLWKVKNWAENDDFLPAKRFWPSFLEFKSDWAEIVHWAAQYPKQFFMFYGSTSENAKKVHFFCNELDQKNIYEKTKIQFVAKKVYFISIF